MAVSCGGIVCGVGFFLAFMLLTEMIESSTEMQSQSDVSTASGGVVFTGRYSLTSDDDNLSGESRQIEGPCQLRGLSKSAGVADLSITNVELRFRQDSIESELNLNSGLLIEQEKDVLEFFGRGRTSPFLFPLINSEQECDIDGSKIEFRRPSIGGLMTSTGEISSSQCKFKITFELTQVNLLRLKRKIVNYSIVSNAISLGLTKLFVDQIRLLDSNSNFSRIALGFVVMQGITDSIDSMINFFIGLSIQFLFNIFIIISLFKFILFSFFEMRMLILAWRQQNANEINSMDPYDSSRIERNWVQTRLYIPMIISLFAIIFYPTIAFVPLVLISQLYWVPQIVHDVVKGHKSPLSPRFVIGVAVARSILPMYVWGCPDTIFNGDVIPSPGGGPSVAFFIAFFQIVQVTLVLTQQRFGPRWFVPWICLPHVYNYYRKIDLDEEFGVPECVVCMSEIDLKNVKDTVVTPCGHLFHSQCLGEWMNLRHECPLCRRELPPIT